MLQQKGPLCGPPVTGSVTVAVVLLAAAVVVAQMVAEGTTGRAAQAGTHGRTGLAAYCAAQQRAAGRAQATADGGFGTVAFARTDSAAAAPPTPAPMAAPVLPPSC